MSNPRYEAQNLTWNGFKETGVWVIARIMLVPTIVFMLFYAAGNDSSSSLVGNNEQSGLPGMSAIKSQMERANNDLARILGGSNRPIGISGDRNGSSGRLLGFGVGSAPTSPGAKWERP